MVSLLTYRIVVTAIYRKEIQFKIRMISNKIDDQLRWKNPPEGDEVHVILLKVNRTLLELTFLSFVMETKSSTSSLDLNEL